MRKAALWIAGLVALAFLALTVLNAHWLAPDPLGAPKQVANGALGPPKGRSGTDCGAARIEEPSHRYIPNTRASILRAQKLGAWMVEVDARLTADREVVLIEEERLDCLTDGGGSVGDKSLTSLRELDTGYGYTVESGETPFRGGEMRIITLREAIRALPLRGRLMVHLMGDDPALADAVAETFRSLERDPAEKGDAFYGSGVQVARIREELPDVWAFIPARGRECTASYERYGWIGYVPPNCRGETMLISLDEQSLLWGWPDRLIVRIEGYGGRIVIEGPRHAGPYDVDGITLPKQLTQIPSSFNGYVWTDDAFTTVPALITRFDDRTQEEIEASEAALSRRRASSR